MPTAPIVILPASISAECETEARRCFPKETGGAFMGRRGSAGEFQVEHMIGPGRRADHRRSSFQPDAFWQWSEMKRLHDDFEGDIAFLGDWHTHPRERRGELSRFDLDALAEILSDGRTRAPSVVSAIVFGEGYHWRWAVWTATIAVDERRQRTLSVRRADIRLTGVLDR